MSNPFVISFLLSSTLFIRVAHSLPPQHNGVASDTAISKKTFKIPEVIITKKTPQSYLNQVTKNLHRNYYTKPYSASFTYQKYIFNPDSLLAFSNVTGTFISSNPTTSLLLDKFFVSDTKQENNSKFNYPTNQYIPKNELYRPLFVDMVRNSVGQLNFDYPVLRFSDTAFPYPFPVHDYHSYSLLSQYEIEKTKYLVVLISDWEKKSEAMNFEDKQFANKYREEYNYYKNLGDDIKSFSKNVIEKESNFMKHKKEQIEIVTYIYEVHINLSDFSVSKIIGKSVKFLESDVLYFNYAIQYQHTTKGYVPQTIEVVEPIFDTINKRNYAYSILNLSKIETENIKPNDSLVMTSPDESIFDYSPETNLIQNQDWNAIKNSTLSKPLKNCWTCPENN